VKNWVDGLINPQQTYVAHSSLTRGFHHSMLWVLSGGFDYPWDLLDEVFGTRIADIRKAVLVRAEKESFESVV